VAKRISDPWLLEALCASIEAFWLDFGWICTMKFDGEDCGKVVHSFPSAENPFGLKVVHIRPRNVSYMSNSRKGVELQQHVSLAHAVESGSGNCAMDPWYMFVCLKIIQQKNGLPYFGQKNSQSVGWYPVLSYSTVT
jgi:hypothetical protein